MVVSRSRILTSTALSMNGTASGIADQTGTAYASSAAKTTPHAAHLRAYRWAITGI